MSFGDYHVAKDIGWALTGRPVDDEELEVLLEPYRGHRLRVQVSGGAFPRYARNHGTGEPLATATTGRTCRFEVLHDAAHPSRLELPVLS